MSASVQMDTLVTIVKPIKMVAHQTLVSMATVLAHQMISTAPVTADMMVKGVTMVSCCKHI